MIITATYKLYKMFKTYNVENYYTRQYEGIIYKMMDQINNDDIEKCKPIVRTILFINCFSYILLISILKDKFNADFHLPKCTTLGLFIAVYGFISRADFIKFKLKMFRNMRIISILGFLVLILLSTADLNLIHAIDGYIGIILAFGIYVLLAFMALLSSNFIVIIVRWIVRHSLNKRNKIGVFMLLLELIFGLPALLSAVLS